MRITKGMSQRAILVILACTLLLVSSACSSKGGGNGPAGTVSPGGTVVASGEHISATVSIASGSATVGQTAGVQIAAARLTAPGLGAWTIVLKYDPAVVSITKCDTGDTFAACNPKASDGTLRLAGATANGLLDDVTLATITLKCEAAGTSDLALTAETLADATVGSPRDIDGTVRNGTITCR
jgi:hypothetical protein